MLQVHRALFHDLIHYRDPALLYGLEPYRSPVPVHRPVHPDPSVDLHGPNRGLQVSDAAPPSGLPPIHPRADLRYRLCPDSGRLPDLHLLLCEEAGILQAV